jgi:hypothetical protein
MQEDPHLQINPDIVFTDLLDGGVLFDLNTKQYFAVNISGLFIWKALENGTDIDTIEKELADRFPSGGADPFGLRGFLVTLNSEGLVIENDEPNLKTEETPSLLYNTLPKQWVAPEVKAHGEPLSEVILSPFDPTKPIPE